MLVITAAFRSFCSFIFSYFCRVATSTTGGTLVALSEGFVSALLATAPRPLPFGFFKAELGKASASFSAASESYKCNLVKFQTRLQLEYRYNCSPQPETRSSNGAHKHCYIDQSSFLHNSSRLKTAHQEYRVKCCERKEYTASPVYCASYQHKDANW